MISALSLVAAVVLAQTPTTRDELAGASIVVNQAINNPGQIVVTRPAAHRACLSRQDNTIPAGAVTVRVGIVVLDQATQRFLFGDGNGSVYAVMEVRAAPSSAEIIRPDDRIDFLPDTEVETRATPAFPTDGTRNCQISIVREGFSGIPWRCACSTGATCTYDPPGPAGSGAAPRGRTLEPGTWSGTGCRPKACVERLGTSSWPAACPLL